jgi:purine-nucleoside phosphorylase
MPELSFEKIQETAAFIRTKIKNTPIAGIILGSGLGSMADMVETETELPYNEIPNFPQSTVEGHAGKLIFGTLKGRNVVMMAGRFHYYEGYSMQEVTFPVRVMKALGVQTLIVSNAAGGMDPQFKVGDIMLIRDHINLFPEHPLRGKNDPRLGTRFPDMSEPYHLGLLDKAKTIARKLDIPVQEGVYIGLQGPTFETRAEYAWLHIIGGHAVGMSTVPEVIVAIHGGMKIFAASIITDLGIRDELNIITHEEVLEAANEAAPKLAAIITELVKSIEQPEEQILVK